MCELLLLLIILSPWTSKMWNILAGNTNLPVDVIGTVEIQNNDFDDSDGFVDTNVEPLILICFAWFSCISFCNHVFTHFFQMPCNFAISPLYPLRTHAILFLRTHGYMSVLNDTLVILFGDNFGIKNVKTIDYRHPGKVISYNLAPSKIQNF